MTFAFDLQNDKDRRDATVLFQSYKIMSLWQIMQAIDTGKIFSIIDHLLGAATVPMPYLVFTPQGQPGCSLTQIQVLHMSSEGYEDIKRDADFLVEELDKLRLARLSATTRRFRDLVYNLAETHGPEKVDPKLAALHSHIKTWVTFGVVPLSNWRDDIVEIKKTFLDELSDRLVMVFPGDKIGYFDGTRNSLGSDIPDTLLDAEHDMEEAGKCYALGRYTSCVFHLMRIMERLVQEFASNLGAEVVRKGTLVEINYAEWHEIEDAIAAKTRNMPRGDRKRRCNAALTTLGAIRLGVRNEVMHPRGFYSDEDAERLLDNVKSFVNDVLTLPLE